MVLKRLITGDQVWRDWSLQDAYLYKDVLVTTSHLQVSVSKESLSDHGNESLSVQDHTAEEIAKKGTVLTRVSTSHWRRLQWKGAAEAWEARLK
jgi:hypothetical protein